jgi:hypothetical protein
MCNFILLIWCMSFSQYITVSLHAIVTLAYSYVTMQRHETLRNQ